MAKRFITIGSLLLVGMGVLSVGVRLASNGTIDLGLPLIFVALGGAVFVLAGALIPRWSWAPALYVPGSLLLALGVIFLFNVVTGDWAAWAYAWLLIVAGMGFGVLLANADRRWPPQVTLAGIGMAAVGLVFFAVIGAIAHGRFIQVAAPVLLVAGGLALYWIKPEIVLPGRPAAHLSPGGAEHPNQDELVEPLSERELEVLRLIDAGLSNPQIAERLTLAPSTVKTHINNIYGKLGVSGRLQAVRRAQELGLLEAPA